MVSNNWEIITKLEAKEKMVAKIIILVAKIPQIVIASVADKAKVVKEATTLMARGMDNLP